jgi:hypothetical protein
MYVLYIPVSVTDTLPAEDEFAQKLFRGDFFMKIMEQFFD